MESARGLEGMTETNPENYRAYFHKGKTIDGPATFELRQKVKKEFEDRGEPLEDEELREYAVYKDADFITVFRGGGNTLKTVARQHHKQMWPTEWAAYERGESQETGTPLSDWNLIDKDRIKLFNFLEVYTVEQYANTPDTELRRFGPGAGKLREEAREFVRRSGHVRHDERIEAAENETAELKKRLEAVERLNSMVPGKKTEAEAEAAPKPRGRGRPRKADAPKKEEEK